jgi:glucose-6-phosphate-specific signal transduction histidine kinase
MALSVGLIVVLVLAVMLLVVLFKLRELKHHIGLVVVIAIILFFAITFAKVYKENKADLSTLDGIIQILKIYSAWLAMASTNFFKIAGYAVQQDWSINTTSLTP